MGSPACGFAALWGEEEEFEVGAELADGGVEGFDGAGGAGEHDAAFHGGEDEGGEGVGLDGTGKARRERQDAFFDGGDPGGEVFGDEFVGGAVLGIDLEGEAAERAAVLAVGGEDAAAVAGEDGEDALDGVWCGGEGGRDDDGLEGVEVAGEDLAEECFFAFEEVVEAAGVDVGVGEEIGHGGASVAALPEEVAGGVDEAVAGGCGAGHSRFLLTGETVAGI